MNRLFTQRPLVKTGIFGLLLLPFVILINEYSPSKDKIPQGYSSSILAFEFVSNQEELQEVLSPLSLDEKRDLNSLNYVDFGFMAIYGIFLFLFMARLGAIISMKLLDKAKWLAPIIVVFDLAENLQLLQLNKLSIDPSTLDSTIFYLGVFTWLKWGVLSLSFAVIGYCMIKMSRSKWFGYLLLIPSFLGIFSFLSGARTMEDLFGTSVFFAFFMLFVYCFVFKLKSASEN